MELHNVNEGESCPGGRWVRPGFDPPVFILLAELRDGLLNDSAVDAHAVHQPPVAVHLAVFLARRVAPCLVITTDLAAKSQGPGSALHTPYCLGARKCPIRLRPVLRNHAGMDAEQLKLG